MVIKCQEDFSKALAWLSKQEKVAYDIETSGLNHRNPSTHIIGIGISNFTTGFYLPIYSYDVEHNLLRLTETAKFAETWLQSVAQKQLITFNGAFDIPFTEARYPVQLRHKLHTDVLLLKHTVDEEFPFKLKEIAVQVFGYGAAQEQRDLQAQVKERGGSKGEIFRADVDLIGKYCIQDCLLTYKLAEHYGRRLAAEGLEDFFYKHEVMPLYREVTIPMEQHGIKLDLPLMQTALQEITVDIQQLEAKIQAEIQPLLNAVFRPWFLGKDYKPSRTGNFAQAYAELNKIDLPQTATGKLSLTAANLAKLPDSHVKSVLLKQEMMTADEITAVQSFMAKQQFGDAPLFNLQSKHHLKKLFFDTLGLEPLSTTDLGNPQVDDEFIHSIIPQYPWAYDLHVYNRLQKIKATYIERFLEAQVDGVFYPSFFQHRTVSGRYGSDIQQMPRKVSEAEEPSAVVRKYNNLIRDFFVARANHTFIGADYESLEPHIFAHVSGDVLLQNIFKQGLDFYSEVALRTEGLEGYSSDKKAPNYLGKMAKELRQKAKAYALGIAYGMSGYKLSFQLGISPEEAEKLVAKYLAAFPDLHKWMQNTQTFVLENGFIASQGGRIRHLKRAKDYYQKFGLSILDSLQLWKDYNSDPNTYAHMKSVRSELKNLLNNGMNFQIQSLAATVVNRAAIAIMREFSAKKLQAILCMNVHDELVVECPLAETEQVCEIMQRNMENIMPLSLPLHAEPQVATVYGATK